MTVENDGVQGIDAILDNLPEDETPAAVAVPEATTEAVVEETTHPETEATTTEEPTKPDEQEPAESLEEAESQVAKLFDTPAKVDHSGGTVPVDKHIALRKRAQDAEARAEALEAKQANVDTGDALAELAELAEGGDDEYVDVAKLKQVLERLPNAINSIAQANINKVVQQANAQSLMSKIGTDETAFRKEHADYDAVTSYVSDRNLLTDDERRSVLAAPNTAEAMYKLSTEKIAKEREILGITTSETVQPKIENQPDGQPATVVDNAIPSEEEAHQYFLNPNS
jgi:hypothetical protein